MKTKNELIEQLKSQCELLVNGAEKEHELNDALFMILETCKELQPQTEVKAC